MPSFRQKWIRCRYKGDEKACRHLYETYWLLPHLEGILNDILEFEPPIVILPEPRPDPPPFTSAFDTLSEALQFRDLASSIITVEPSPEPMLGLGLGRQGDPSPQPNRIVSPTLQIEAAKELCAGLEKAAEALRDDIDELEGLADK